MSQEPATSNEPAAGNDREIVHDLRLKRLQRGAEYALLASMHLFFLLAFRQYYTPWMALLLAAATFGMNFQLTQLRERRRTSSVDSRKRIVADAFESVLFLALIALLSASSALARTIHLSDQEYLAYVAALLGGFFMAGLAGELYWQARNFSALDRQGRRNYVANLKRTIILPYSNARRR